MKATGIVRRVDELGRVVIPKEIRRTLGIHENDPLEIFTDHDGNIIYHKYEAYDTKKVSMSPEMLDLMIGLVTEQQFALASVPDDGSMTAEDEEVYHQSVKDMDELRRLLEAAND